MAKESFEKTTRRIFHKIHVVQGETPQIFNRLKMLLSPEYLQLPADYFGGKVCLDAGCGSNANATSSMLQWGAGKVYAFDLDNTIRKSVPKYLKGFEGRYELGTGDVLRMDYPSRFFDFVHCAGVLHHTRDVFRGLKELARVTKVGGILVFSVYGKGGLAREITSLLRTKYAQDRKFRSLIDNLTHEDLLDAIRWMLSSMKRHGDDYADSLTPLALQELIDKDLVLTIQDRIQAPVYLENSEEELVSWLKAHGFTKIKRLRRYPKYRNVRRFLSPLYYEYDHPVARLFYGSGFVQLKAVKAR